MDRHPRGRYSQWASSFLLSGVAGSIWGPVPARVLDDRNRPLSIVAF